LFIKFSLFQKISRIVDI